MAAFDLLIFCSKFSYLCRLYSHSLFLFSGRDGNHLFLDYFGRTGTSHLSLFICDETSVVEIFFRDIYSFARTAVAKHYRLRGLNNRNLRSHRCGGLKAKSQVSAWLVPPEASVLGLQMVFSSPRTHNIFSVCLCPNLFFFFQNCRVFPASSHLIYLFE